MAAQHEVKQRNICLSVVTRNRPKMLCNLFASLFCMDRPYNTKISFLVVENNAAHSLEAVIQSFRTMMPNDDINYRLEPIIGISSARNCALNYAIEQGFDFLIYVDDDEMVEKNWLVALLATRDRLDLDIVGSPVRPKAADENLTLMQRLVMSGLEHVEIKSERKCKRKCDKGQGDTIKVATGSWLGRLDFFRHSGLRFDHHFGITGGEDWELWAKAKSLGAKTGWACDAIVYEAVPSSRLTLSYHYRRGRDHNITQFSACYRQNPVRTLTRMPAQLFLRAVKFLGTMCMIPFRGGHGLVSCAKALGGLVGFVQGCVGKSSLHYAETTGS